MQGTEGRLSYKSGLSYKSRLAMAHLGLRSPAGAKGTAGAPSAVWGLCGEMIPEGSAGKGATSRDQEGTGIPLKSHQRLPRSLSF